MFTPEQTLQNLARLDPDFPAFAALLPNELTRAAETLPEGLAADILTLLREERPELSKWLDAQPSSPPPAKFIVESATGVGLLLAALFLVRTHIKVEGVNFKIEIKPMSSKLLIKVLETFKDILSSK